LVLLDPWTGDIVGHGANSNFPKLSVAARRALARAGCERLEQLDGDEEADLSRLHGMGPIRDRGAS
jgi:hypothetical protein